MLFASAMHAFDAGTYRKADELFHRFSQRFSEDPRAEDASFLRVVCALRLGDRAAVEAHAHEYLGAHPQGLRRQEVERLLY
jgi:TolA-binding protein